jgi:predicted PurR-regulated permease PerM
MRLSQNLAPFWWLRWAPAAALIALVLYLIYIIGRVAVVPLLASFALAYLLNPLVIRIERLRVARPYAVLLALAVVALIAGAFLTFIIPELWDQIASAGQKLLRYFTPENAARQRSYIRRYSPLLDRLAGERIEQVLSNPAEAFGAPAGWLFGGLSGFLSAAASSLDLLLVPFFVFYTLMDFGRWRDSIEDLIPPRFRRTFSRLFDEVGRILEAYVRGQLLIALVMAALYAAGFAIIRVPAWAGVAMLIGLLNIIPYLGTALGLTLAIGFTIADGGSFWRIIGVASVFAVAQIIEGYYLTPRILGARLSLHPIAVFLGMLIGGKLFGLLGVILAVPTIAVAKVFLMFFRELYKGSYLYHAGKINPAEAPSEALEERLAIAAEMVLQEQEQAQTRGELLTPDAQQDNPAVRSTS